MTVRGISIDAYAKHISSGKALTQWMKIYEFLKDHRASGATRNEIAIACGMRIPSVCGRVKEMLDSNIIVEQERRKCAITDEAAHPVIIKEPPCLNESMQKSNRFSRLLHQ